MKKYYSRRQIQCFVLGCNYGSGHYLHALLPVLQFLVLPAVTCQFQFVSELFWWPLVIDYDLVVTSQEWRLNGNILLKIPKMFDNKVQLVLSLTASFTCLLSIPPLANSIQGVIPKMIGYQKIQLSELFLCTNCFW